MRIERCELLHLRVPFATAFSHARARRTATDTVFLLLADGSGNVGTGEVLAREYVTGESAASVFDDAGPALCARLLGLQLADQSALVRWIDAELEREETGPALLGAAELALLGLAEASSGIRYDALLGPRRTTAPGRCITLGFEVPTERLRDAALRAVFGGATAVKVKVGGAEDEARVRQAAARLAPRVALRLDANGALSYDAALALLRACRALPIDSLEQPFPAAHPDLREQLQALHAETGVALMADESVCRLSEARAWAASRAFQRFNVRVGKCGGLRGCARMLDIAAAAGIGAVGGTLVGESALLDRASELLLEHRADLPYVEGLGQHRTLLSLQPTSASPAAAGPLAALRVSDEARQACTIASRVVGDAPVITLPAQL